MIGSLRFFSLALAAGLLLAAGMASPALAQKDEEGGRVDTVIQRSDAAAEDERLYVCNQGEASVAVIDMATNEVIETVDLQALGFTENARPHHAVAEPDGSAWYVSLIGDNTVLKFDRDNELVGQVSFEAPGMLTLHPTRDLLYVGRSMSAVDPPQSIGVVSRTSMDDLLEIDTFFPRPHPMFATEDGQYVYTASLATNQLMGVDPETQRGELTTLGGDTQVFVQFAATPDGQTLIAGGQTTGQLLLFDASGAPELTVTDTLSVGLQPWHPVIDAEGRYAYVPNKMSNSISVVDLGAREVVDTIEDERISEPHGSALSADGRYLYVSNNHRRMDTAGSNGEHGTSEERNGTVAVIDLDAREVVDVIEVGVYPTGIGTRAWR